MKPATSYRWTICALVFFATTINYLDRSIISLLKSQLEIEFRWTESDYANIVIAFQVSYALGLFGVGRLIDRLGTKIGYGLVFLLWNLAAMAHAAVRSTFGFFIVRGSLGLAEAGNFPAAIKTIAEWFPPKERALATGIFNSGANVGAIITPLVVPYIAEKWGWQWAFILAGAIGFVWLFFWYVLYSAPQKNKKVSESELEYITGDENNKTLSAGEAAKSISGEEAKNFSGEERKSFSAEDRKSFSWAQLLSLKQTWAFAIGKFLTDSAWWFYLFWLPDILKKSFSLSAATAGLLIALAYTIATVGSIFGGWLPLWFIKKGKSVSGSRSLAMLIFAFCALPVTLAQWTGTLHMGYAVFIIGFAMAAHQAWSANIYTLVSDLFPKRAVASVTGIGGMFGAVGGILISKIAGITFDYYKSKGNIETGYEIIFIICGLVYLVAWGIIRILLKNTHPVQ
jgi:MFS transporter, ACS family, hexuronate transporter